MSAPRTDLYTQMVELFNDNDLRELCFTLRFNYEDLPAVYGISGKVRELILVFERQGRMAELLTAVHTTRPHTTWPDPATIHTIDTLLGEPLKPLLPNEPETVPVPAGAFLMGSNEHDPAESPQHEVQLPTFYIGKFAVTNQQYAEFVSRARYTPPPASAGWALGKPAREKLNHPVVSVSWYDAVAYCRWLSEYTSKTYRLPTEAEWEKAAQGIDGRLYPWGNTWQEKACHVGYEETTAVDSYSDFASPSGCLNMVGNATEWTLSRWGDDRHQSSYPYPYNPLDGRDDPADDPLLPRLRRIYRGGSFKDEAAVCRCSARDHTRPDSASPARGFRVVWER